MSMGKQHGVNARRGNGERFPVTCGQLVFLEQAAVNQESLAVSFQQVFGAGYVVGSPEKRYLNLQFSILSAVATAFRRINSTLEMLNLSRKRTNLAGTLNSFDFRQKGDYR
jgi:hypothetical protein